MWDFWEMQHFGTLTNTANGNNDGEAFMNYEDFNLAETTGPAQNSAMNTVFRF